MYKINTIKVIPPEEDESDSEESSMSSQQSGKDSLIDKINENTRKLRRDIFGQLMEYKSHSRDFIHSIDLGKVSQDSKKLISLEPPESTGCKNKTKMYKDLNTLIKMYNDLLQANTNLIQAKAEICTKEQESLDLHAKLQSLQSSVASTQFKNQEPPSCKCLIM